MSISEADKAALYSNMMDIRHSLAFVQSNVDKCYDKTMASVTEKVKVLEDKVVRVQDVIKETVQYSERTYYMEEARKLKGEKVRAEKERGIWKEKYKQVKKTAGGAAAGDG